MYYYISNYCFCFHLVSSVLLIHICIYLKTFLFFFFLFFGFQGMFSYLFINYKHNNTQSPTVCAHVPLIVKTSYIEKGGAKLERSYGISLM